MRLLPVSQILCAQKKCQFIMSQTILEDALYVTLTKNQKSDLWLLHHYCMCQTHGIFALDFNWNVTVTGSFPISKAVLFALFDGMCRMHFVPPWIFNWLEPDYPMYNLKQACCCLPIWSSLVIMKSAVFIRGISLHHSQCRDMYRIKQASLSHLFLALLFPTTKRRANHCCTQSALPVVYLTYDIVCFTFLWYINVWVLI